MNDSAAQNPYGDETDAGPWAAEALAVVAVSGAAISTLGGILGVETVSSTDRHIGRVDELQFDLGEGPCWDALASGLPVLEPDLVGAPRRFWPAFSPAVAREPIAALFAFPMHVGPFRIGAIDLYDVRPRALDDDDVTRAVDFAARTGRRVLRRALQLADAPDDEPPLPHARRVIHQAIGFVIAQVGVPADEAELLIRASAFSEGRPMREIADEIVARRRRFVADGSVIEQQT
jgi:GAF domain-containing protein